MIWWQFLLTITSPLIAAAIPQIFALILQKKQFKQTQDFKNQEEEKIKNEQKAQNLYQIIKPALTSVEIQEYLEDPKTFNNDFRNSLWANISIKNENIQSALTSVLEQLRRNNKYDYYSKNALSQQSLLKMIEMKFTEEKDLLDFFNRYGKDINISKLNSDIDFINEKLGLYIEHLEKNSKES